MFKELRRKEKAIGSEEAKALLKTERRGVLSVNGEEGYPYSVPINFFYEENTNRIYFHGSKLGQKAEALKKSDKVCFTAYGNEQIKKEDWAPYLQSVVIFGRCHPIQDFELLRKFGKKYYPDHILLEKEIEAFKEKVQLYEITIEHISGKQIQEK